MTSAVITQQELERLLKESKEIAQDWDTYTQFRQNRDAILQQIMSSEGRN
ncbi:MAG TPA: hypothetical protein V6C99_00405 [Oculatellaceae cyanobacterium]|jgi:hypothetical protein